MTPHEVRIQSNKVSETRTNIPSPVISAVLGTCPLCYWYENTQRHSEPVILNEVKNLSLKNQAPQRRDSSFALLRTSASLRMTMLVAGEGDKAKTLDPFSD